MTDVDGNSDYRRETWKLSQIVSGMATQITFISGNIDKVTESVVRTNDRISVLELAWVEKLNTISNRLEKLEAREGSLLTLDEQKFIRESIDDIRAMRRIYTDNINVRLALTDKEIEALRDFLEERVKLTDERNNFLRGLKVTVVAAIISGAIFGVITPLLAHYFIH